MLVVGGLIEGISGWMGRKKAIVIGVSLGWKYVVLAGWEIPVVRAMLLMSVVYLAQLLGRKYCLWRGVLGSSLVMILGEPRVLLSVSFWLSLTAFMGIATKKLVINKFELKIKNKLFKNIFDSFFETVWIMIWITPILALVFGEISWIAPMANILVIGLVQIVTVWGMVGAMGGMLFEELGRWMLWLTIPILRYLMYISRLTGSFQGWKISFNWWMVAGYYLILICLLWRKNNEKQQI
jgi:competence protein ComEC